jgi:hypothetical protein
MLTLRVANTWQAVEVQERYKLKGYSVQAKHYRNGWRVFITKAG